MLDFSKMTLQEKMQVWELAVKAVTILGVFGGAFGMYLNYTQKQSDLQMEALKRQDAMAKDDRDQQDKIAREKREHEDKIAQEKREHDERIAAETETRRKEFFQKQKDIGLEHYKKKMALYYQVCEITATIATAERRADVEKEIRAFKILYAGTLGLVESLDVVKAQVEFMKALNKWHDGPPIGLFDLTRTLSKSCREHLHQLDEEQRNPYLGEALDRLARLTKSVEHEGLFQKSSNKYDLLNESKDFSFEAVLEAGKKYRLIATGDRDVDDVGLEIKDKSNQVKAIDKTAARDAALNFTPPVTGNYTVRVSLLKSRDHQRSFCAVAVLEVK
jgi:hypothetical protein